MNFCKKKDFDDIISSTLKDLKKANSKDNSKHIIRILQKDDINYIRAITSAKYGDYNIKFSVFVSLISLHKLMIETGDNFYVNNYYISDSEINVIFKKREFKKLVGNSYVSFALRLVNDEVKREAVNLHGIYTISFENNSDLSQDLVIQPINNRESILRIPHVLNIKIEDKVANLSTKISDFEKYMYDDIQSIKDIKKPDSLREYILDVVQRSNSSSFKSLYKDEVKRILLNKVDSILDLLESFRKIELLINQEDIQSKDYWRGKLYSVLMDRKKY